MRDKILLIGNAPSILSRECGEKIDNFEGKIARFNHYKIDGYERYIGTRTDILILGQLDATEHLNEQYDYILLYQSRLDGGRGLRKIKNLSPHNKIIFFPIHQKDVINDILNLDRNIQPTTGLIAICWFIHLDVELYIYGFNFGLDDYFEQNTETNNSTMENHNLKQEKDYVEYLCENNKLKWLI